MVDILIIMGRRDRTRTKIANFRLDMKKYLSKSFNRLSRRKRGMVSNPLFIIPDFFCIFPITLLWLLRFEGNGKIPMGR